MPLTSIITNESIAKYRIAFHMFWRLKRVEWSLSLSWKQMTTFTHSRGDIYLPKLKSIIHRCTLYRSKMMHVVNNLCAFIMFEVSFLFLFVIIIRFSFNFYIEIVILNLKVE